ncbi:helix-turn-helix domain-containing protein [Maledivibacter halophilus]|uniref:DNA-binding transcriptional regulator, XRE-family HTH domain n=1 Tax=Maledivibacter halophilus TaxID=36842 RepID=A0A1T5MFX1_9FIRM|nr:helix-turn-helix transcriptional regulator [Maledivibacter halophilus]SKC86973.1 DNA-binding transcriptional regulator, XRE-family HTH domain [Maledivibacter halophilus]
MENINKFKNRLKNLRKEKDLTQKDLANKLGIVRTAVANYETGRTIPDSQTLLIIADILDTTTDYLLGRTDVRNPEKPKIETKAFHTIDTDGLPDEAIRQVEEYVELIKLKYKQDKK